jgi:uncharacterized membrane protein YuzA (DUF378 family)
MKALHMIAFVLLVVGGLNWLLYAIAGWEIGALLGGMDSMLAKIVYGLVGLSAIYLAVMHPKECRVCKPDGMTPAM